MITGSSSPLQYNRAVLVQVRERTKTCILALLRLTASTTHISITYICTVLLTNHLMRQLVCFYEFLLSKSLRDGILIEVVSGKCVSVDMWQYAVITRPQTLAARRLLIRIYSKTVLKCCTAICHVENLNCNPSVGKIRPI
jgi:hypothetical protein